jgi:hypothetical protein
MVLYIPRCNVMMLYPVKALLTTIATVAIALGTVLITQASVSTVGYVLVAIGLGINAAAEYLAEQGVITKKG